MKSDVSADNLFSHKRNSCQSLKFKKLSEPLKANLQLATFYRSRADFFQILDDKKEIDPKELIAILTPDLKFEKEEFPLNQTVEIASKIKNLVDDLMGIFPNKEDKSKEEKKE